MAVMDRIERAAKDANAHYRVLRAWAAIRLTRPITAVGPDDQIAANSAFQTVASLAVIPCRDKDAVRIDEADGALAMFINEFGSIRPSLNDSTGKVLIIIHVPYAVEVGKATRIDAVVKSLRCGRRRERQQQER
jgi:hypothetical protein